MFRLVVQKKEKETDFHASDDTEITALYAADAEDVDIAVKAARAAFNDPSWAELAPSERGNLIYKLADLCEKHTDVLAALDTWDMGKPYSVAKAEDLAEVVSVFR